MHNGGYAREDVLVDPVWLEEHLHDPALRLVEVDVNPLAYDEGHIPGAVLWNIYRDLRDSGYGLVDADEIEKLISRSGIDAGSTVVFYGYGPALGFWLMKLYRHADVRILDCSRDAWKAADRPWTTEVPVPSMTRYHLPEPDHALRADQKAVEEAIGESNVTILDVRTDLEFRGERFWPSGGMEPGGRAGHVPSAVNQAIDGLRDDEGAFRSAADVRHVLAKADQSAGELVTYCTVGSRACTTWFALTYLLGRDNVRVYDGSWAQWGRMAQTPVETG
ncbi:MAG TPA: sulfurtransferase [Micrococcaceae bacterium]|jgi:thiosulfate/3-mercaptopyruvate sulfurtransferase|nr:sulfurtransferase [Micrococcaceae bacterium]